MLMFVDTETTDLKPDEGHLLEVGFILTNDHLAEFWRWSCVVGYDAPLRLCNDPFIRDMHHENGLWSDSQEAANRGLTLPEVRRCAGERLDAVESAFDISMADIPLAGSTVGFDRSWLARHMPEIEARFHYRSVDVSTIKELARRWNKTVFERRPNQDGAKAHRVLEDLEFSIDELKHYREAFLR